MNTTYFMVYLIKANRGAKTYYYLAENARVGRGRRKLLKKYLGSAKPGAKQLAALTDQFQAEIEVKKHALTGYHYLLPDEIKHIDKTNNGFLERYRQLNPTEREQFDQNFVNVFVYNSNSIAGSTLTAREVRLLLEENIAPNKDLEDVLEARNAQKTLALVKATKTPFDLGLLCQLHETYFKDTKPFIAGKLKTKDNFVRGARFQTTKPAYILTDLKLYFSDYARLAKELHPLELAAWAHWKFEKIHPFQDGNGRIGRLVMNYVLFRHGYQMIDIKTREKQRYFKALAACDRNNAGEPLARLLVKRFTAQYLHALKEGK